MSRTRLIVPLSGQQQNIILNFFIDNPHLQQIEHHLHTHSPLDNLEHYMWEELHEPEHIDLLRKYQKNKGLSNHDIDIWIEQETGEKEESESEESI
jgi:hypothetical protein